MKKSELLGKINALSRNSIGAEGAEITAERSEALDRYHGRPYGDEKDGRSKVVSHALAETVDWLMCSLMKVFLQSGNIVEFLPVGAEDEELAQQESDYVNHVMLEQNDGFMWLYDWIKDALILKNGYCKAYWKETTETTVEKYKGFTPDDITKLFHEYDMEETEYKVLSQDERKEGLMIEGQHIDLTVFDLEIRVTRNEAREHIEAIPAEEILVSRRARGKLNDCDYIEHITRKSRSELIEMGMDKKFVNSLAYNSGEYTDNDQESFARDSVFDENEYRHESIDESMDQVEVREVYCMVDFDGDGVAERRRVTIAGHQIPDGDEWNQEIDYYSIYYCTPNRMPHRHIGISVNDDIEDLAKIDTALWRGTLDNTYSQVNQEWLVNERVNLDDFLVSRPRGVKRVADKMPVDGAAMPVPKPNILPHVLPVMDRIDKLKATRTGVNPPVTGVDPDALKEVREKPANDNLDKANQKIEMIARMMADGVKDLARGVHADIMKYQDKSKMVRLRGKWVEINPQEWRHRTDLKVTVGLGNGNREETKDTVRMIAEAQEALFEMGGVEYKHAYTSFTKLTKALGEPNPESYAMNPDEHEQKMQQMQQQAQQNPPQNPLAEAEMVKAKAMGEMKKLDVQSKMQQSQMDHEIKRGQLSNDAANTQLKFQELMLKARALEIEAEKMGGDLSLKEFSEQVKAEAEAFKAQAEERKNDLKQFEVETKGMIEQAKIATNAAVKEAEISAKLKSDLSKQTKSFEIIAPSGEKYVGEVDNRDPKKGK